MSHPLLIINPGSTSTKLALYDQTSLREVVSLSHAADELCRFCSIVDQYQFRLQAVEDFLLAQGNPKLTAVVGRGGLLKPLASGCYLVNERMAADLRQGVQGQHASNLGGLLAQGIAAPRGIPALIVDPVSVDEFSPLARLSGLPQISRRSLGHGLNIRAVARRVAEDAGRSLLEMNFVVAHLGGGISVAPLSGGRILDYNNANEEGPFSPERAGSLPARDVVSLAFSGQHSLQELIDLFNRRAGLVAYLGSNDARQAIARAEAGDQYAQLVLAAMAYQIAKEISAMATVLCGRVDAIILTGGLAHARYITDQISGYVQFIAPVVLSPGEDEMLALAEGASSALSGQEPIYTY
ncbi:MAG: butyrate kinase [Bacillota bacterium]